MSMSIFALVKKEDVDKSVVMISIEDTHTHFVLGPWNKRYASQH